MNSVSRQANTRVNLSTLLFFCTPFFIRTLSIKLNWILRIFFINQSPPDHFPESDMTKDLIWNKELFLKIFYLCLHVRSSTKLTLVRSQRRWNLNLYSTIANITPRENPWNKIKFPKIKIIFFCRENKKNFTMAGRTRKILPWIIWNFGKMTFKAQWRMLFSSN